MENEEINNIEKKGSRILYNDDQDGQAARTSGQIKGRVQGVPLEQELKTIMDWRHHGIL